MTNKRPDLEEIRKLHRRDDEQLGAQDINVVPDDYWDDDWPEPVVEIKRRRDTFDRRYGVDMNGSSFWADGRPSTGPMHADALLRRLEKVHGPEPRYDFYPGCDASNSPRALKQKT